MPTPPTLSETPTGDLALPFTSLATLLSESATFQAMCGVNSAALALPFIDYPLRDVASYDFPVPGAIISDDDSLSQHRKRTLEGHGQLLLQLFDEVKDEYQGDQSADPVVPIDWRNDDIAMRNRFGAILNEVRLSAGGRWGMTQWRKVGSPTHLGPPDYQRLDPDAFRWIRYAAFIIDWV